MFDQDKKVNDFLDELEETGQLGQDGEELIQSLYLVSAANEYMNSFPVQLGKAIVAERIKRGLSQQQLAKLVEEVTNEKMAQSTISKVEGGFNGIKGGTYDKVFKALGLSIITLPTIELVQRHQHYLRINRIKKQEG